MCRHTNQGIWNSLGRGGDPFWLHTEPLTFMGPASYQNTAVFEIGVNKIPPKLDDFRSRSTLSRAH